MDGFRIVRRWEGECPSPRAPLAGLWAMPWWVGEWPRPRPPLAELWILRRWEGSAWGLGHETARYSRWNFWELIALFVASAAKFMSKIVPPHGYIILLCFHGQRQLAVNALIVAHSGDNESLSFRDGRWSMQLVVSGQVLCLVWQSGIQQKVWQSWRSEKWVSIVLIWHNGGPPWMELQKPPLSTFPDDSLYNVAPFFLNRLLTQYGIWMVRFGRDLFLLQKELYEQLMLEPCLVAPMAYFVRILVENWLQHCWRIWVVQTGFWKVSIFILCR